MQSSTNHVTCRPNTLFMALLGTFVSIPLLHPCIVLFCSSLPFYALLHFHLSFLSSLCPFGSSLLPLDNIRQYLPFCFDTVTLNSTASYCEYADDLSHGATAQDTEIAISLLNSQDE